MKKDMNYYLNQLSTNLDAYPDVIYIACKNMLLKMYDNNLKDINYLSFDRLYDWSNIKDFEQFKIALYILVDSKFNILEQHFEAFNMRNGRYEGVEDDFIYEVLNTNVYLDPFTYEEISESDFCKNINIFFSPSIELKENFDV